MKLEIKQITVNVQHVLASMKMIYNLMGNLQKTGLSVFNCKKWTHSRRVRLNDQDLLACCECGTL